MRLFATLMIAAALALSAACGSGEDDAEPTATFPPGFTPQPPGLLTPGPPPTMTPAEMELEPYTSENLPYSISIPAGYTTEGNDRFQYSTPDKGLVSEIVVNCTRPAGSGFGVDEPVPPEAMSREDGRILRESNAPVASVESFETTLDDKPAVFWRYNIALAGGASLVQQFVWYVGDRPCGWRVRMLVYGQEPIESYDALFKSISETFDGDATLIPTEG